jgi:CubicO group peptidase (beta-lactamase class C family)
MPRLPRLFVLPALVLAVLVAGCGSGDADESGTDDSTTGAAAPPADCVAGEVAGEHTADITGLAEEVREQLGLEAVLVRVDRGGDEVATVALGESMPGVPVEADMRFWNGAAVFSYLGTAVLQLHDEGVLDIDEPIDTYLPDVSSADEITPRMLMATTSGYVDYVPMEAFIDSLYADPFRPFTLDELEAYVFAEPLLFEPGTNISYSHLNFQLAGRVIEEATGQPLADVLAERILEPLAMADTESLATADIPGPALRTYTDERGSYEDSSAWSPAWGVPEGATMATTVCDLAKGAAGVGSGELLSEQSFATFLDPGTTGLPGPSEDCPTCIPESEDLHFGFGVISAGDWTVQTPQFTGIAGVQAHLPDQDLSIGIASTITDEGDVDTNGSTVLFERLVELLAPEHPVPPLS